MPILKEIIIAQMLVFVDFEYKILSQPCKISRQV